MPFVSNIMLSFLVQIVAENHTGESCYFSLLNPGNTISSVPSIEVCWELFQTKKQKHRKKRGPFNKQAWLHREF